MARYEVVIETRRDMDAGCITAWVADGPDFLRDYTCRAGLAEDAFKYLRLLIVGDYGSSNFDFLHVES